MKLTKTAKLQIYTSENDKSLLLESMKAYSDACNYISQNVPDSVKTKILEQMKHINLSVYD